MRERRDLVHGWLRKADSDLATLELALQAGQALDTACFHAQQAAEKVLKAYSIAFSVDFPFTHNLARLLLLCQARDAAFSTLSTSADILTPYAVELRYDNDFWPTVDAVREARDAALAIRAFVLPRLPPELGQPGP
jgi:HEPN domain-containing protein